jgi:hypothetical protein
LFPCWLYIPEFEKSFRHPRNWGAWLGVYTFAGIAMLPAAPNSGMYSILFFFVSMLVPGSGDAKNYSDSVARQSPLRHQTLEPAWKQKKIILNTFLSLKNPFDTRATGEKLFR